LEVISKREHLKDFAFSVYGAAGGDEYFEAIAKNLESMSSKISFFRLSIANTGATEANMSLIAERLKKFN